jgi:CDP-diacylglycerol---glycerol-3-phosphate 3-phosphatidyltransferase
MLYFSTITIPIFLTLLRLLLAPFLIPFLIVLLDSGKPPFVYGLLALVFIAFSVTDFFDGYLARYFNQESVLGKVLDPLADKCLLYSTLIGLLVIGRIHFIWVILFIGREFLLMGLRLIALENGLRLDVSWVAKIKTTVQMFYLTLVIARPFLESFPSMTRCHAFEQGALFVSLGLSFGSAYVYYKTLCRDIEIRLYEDDSF